MMEVRAKAIWNDEKGVWECEVFFENEVAKIHEKLNIEACDDYVLPLAIAETCGVSF